MADKENKKEEKSGKNRSRGKKRRTRGGHQKPATQLYNLQWHKKTVYRIEKHKSLEVKGRWA